LNELVINIIEEW